MELWVNNSETGVRIHGVEQINGWWGVRSGFSLLERKITDKQREKTRIKCATGLESKTTV